MNILSNFVLTVNLKYQYCLSCFTDAVSKTQIFLTKPLGGKIQVLHPLSNSKAHVLSTVAPLAQALIN